MHRSNLGRETKTSLLSKAILEPEKNASFLKPQLIVQKKHLLSFDLFTSKSPNHHFLFPSGPPRRRRAFLGKLWEATLIVQSSGVLNSKAPHVAAWLAPRLPWQLCPVVLQAGGWWKKNPEVDVFFIQKRGGKG